mgnify:CR=1 FL=1
MKGKKSISRITFLNLINIYIAKMEYVTYKKSGPMYLSWSKKKSSIHSRKESIPPRNKKSDFSRFWIRPESELNKAIDADTDHIKIPKLEINPTQIGYPHVWARSRITNIDLIPNELDKPKSDKYINKGAMIDEDKKTRLLFFICL